VNPYDVVSEFEARVAEYAGAAYGVACDSCTDAIYLSLLYRQLDAPFAYAWLPRRTYVGVAYSVINSGSACRFDDTQWSGAYEVSPHDIIDSARRFRRGMYQPDTLYCLSFHWGKHLPVGRGGMILTDDAEAARVLRLMRFDGRTAGVKPADDNYIYPSIHSYMTPELAARGLMLMNYAKDDNPDLPNSDYPDLSKYPIFQEGYPWQRQ